MKQKGLKIGKETGSAVNWMMSNNSTEPKALEGATLLMWTDRHAYTITKVSEDKKQVTIQRCNAKRIDNLGMTDSGQEYDYSEHENSFMNLVYRNGSWRQVIEQVVLTESFRKEFEVKEKEDKNAWKEMIQPLFNDDNFLNLVEGKTKTKKSFPKVSILFGTRQEYYDFSF